MLKRLKYQPFSVTFLDKKQKEIHQVKALHKGDELAQKEVYELYAPKMLSVCRNFISNFHVAEEVMHNGFVKVFFNIKKYKAEGSFEGWIRKIMIRECLSFLRKKKYKVDEYSEEILKNQKTYQKPVEETSEIQRLIDRLPLEFKVVFNLYAIEGYKHQEIAEMLSIAETTSKTRLFRARKILKEQLQIVKKSNGRF